jgi:predicted RNase H-like HicB family nuclease
MSYKVNVVIEKDECGYYAFCPELEGCQTQGDTLEEILANIKEAIELYLETMTEDEIREHFFVLYALSPSTPRIPPCHCEQSRTDLTPN